jgi:hypothetical protein
MSDVDGFPTDPTDQPDAKAPTIEVVPPGGSFDFRIHPVKKALGNGDFRMLSYNGSIPGLIIRVRQG